MGGGAASDCECVEVWVVVYVGGFGGGRGGGVGVMTVKSESGN